MILLLALALLAGPASADVIIRNDSGGWIAGHDNQFDVAHRQGQRFVIDGWCASSCTLVLRYPSTCATRRAMLGFHSAYFGIGSVRFWTDQADTRYLMDSYPPRVQRWINARGGLTPRLKILRGRELAALVKGC